MADIKAIITYNGDATSVTIHEKDMSIVDASGKPFTLPDGVSVDGNGNLVRNGLVVGRIDLNGPNAQMWEPLNDRTTSGSTGGGGSSSGTTAPADQNLGDDISQTEVEYQANSGTTTGHAPTATLANGGYVKPTTSGTGGGDDPSGGTGGGDDPGSGDPGSGDPGGDGSGTDDSGGGGGGGGADDSGGGGGGGGDGGDPTTDDTTDDYVDDETDPSGSENPTSPGVPQPAGAGFSLASLIPLGMSLAQQLSKGGKFSLGNLFPKKGILTDGKVGAGAKVLGVGGLIMGGWGAFNAFKSIGQGTGGWMNAAISDFGFITSWAVLFGSSLASMGIAAGVILAINLIGFLFGKRKDNALNLAGGDVGGLANTGAITGTGASASSAAGHITAPWYKMPAFPTQNVFMILAGVALMNVGIDLSINAPLVQSVKVSSMDLPAVRDALERSVKKPLPSVATGVLGKVFIQSAGNNGLSPDRVVFVTEDGSGTGYNLNQVALEYDGVVVGATPDSGRIPFFQPNANGAIVANPRAAAALGAQNAMAMTATAPGLRARSRVTAVNAGKIQGHEVELRNQ
jgi:hypothetical protein